MSSAKTAVAALSALMLAACGGNSSSSRVAPGTTFEVTVENTSDRSFLPTPLAPGVLVVHDDTGQVFTPGAPDAGLGLEALAEDGDATPLAGALRFQPGTLGVRETDAIPPGQSRTYTVVATPQSGRLSLATMVVQSNDLFFANGGNAIELFDANGDPLPGRDVTNRLQLWDAGTETNETPGSGLNQPFRQAGPNTGAAEGVVHAADHGTRALPPAANLASITVTESGGTYTLNVENVAVSRGGFSTPLAPLFWAVHDGGFRLFDEGQPALSNGLETLAEDGSPAGLLLAAASDAAVSDSGASAGPAMPGDMFSVSITPTAGSGELTLACMIVESNDLFVSSSVSLLDGSGQLRPASDVEDELMARLAVWDAGTEVNQAPGGGADQPLRQSGPNTGAPDSDATVRRADDRTNDFAQGSAFAQVSVTAGAAPGSLDLVLTNVSGTSFGGVLTPVAFAVHARGNPVFVPGQPASPGLERLAEDGDPSTLAAELGAMAGVTGVAVQNTPTGSGTPGPIAPGQSYAFSVTADRDHPYLSLVTMVVPSNDTFLSLSPGGVMLVDPATGTPRSAVDVQADLQAALSIWDAGTEKNQVGAAGSDQAPRQAGPDTGRDEGDGTVRVFNDPTAYPVRERMIRVTIRPR